MVVRLTRNGNTITACIPRPMIEHLQWLPGDHIAIVVNENHTLTLVRIDPAALVRAATAVDTPHPAAEATV